MKVVVVGAGMGGLAAALHLARQGHEVEVLEARTEAGGLASPTVLEGLTFDSGPYILLDRPGLEWAFRGLGLELSKELDLRSIEHVYRVTYLQGEAVDFYASLERTAAGMEGQWPGSGPRYIDFVSAVREVHERLRPLLTMSHPGPGDVLRSGAWRGLPFLARSLGTVLRDSRLPAAVVEAIGIWTHVAGQRLETAPSPLAFVPALIHSVGAWYSVGGIGRLPQALEKAGRAAGVSYRFATRVNRILTRDGRVTGVETSPGERVQAHAVVSNASGVGTYLELLDCAPPARSLSRLPLQSPGACAYLRVKGGGRAPYLRFLLPGGDGLCRLLIQPSVMQSYDGWAPARLLSPMRYEHAESLDADGQRAWLESLLAESWWRDEFEAVEVLGRRVPADWGREFTLYRNSMNPVMTAAFMRAGRMAHRSPYARGLYLAGSSTHPGQWVSFCAISGILAATLVEQDLHA